MPSRDQMILDILHSLADNPSVSPHIKAKTRGAQRWLEVLSDCTLRPLMLAHRHWFTIEDILAVLTIRGRATMWSQSETPLQNSKNWLVLEGTSKFGEQMASSFSELIVALLPNRLNGIQQSSHVRVSPAPADGLSTLALNFECLACLLFRDYAQDPTNKGSASITVYIVISMQASHVPQVMLESPGVNPLRAEFSSLMRLPREGDLFRQPPTPNNTCAQPTHRGHQAYWISPRTWHNDSMTLTHGAPTTPSVTQSARSH